MADYTIDLNSEQLTIGAEATTGRRVYTYDPDVTGTVALPSAGDPFDAAHPDCRVVSMQRVQPERGKQTRLSYAVQYSTDYQLDLLLDRRVAIAHLPRSVQGTFEIAGGSLLTTATIPITRMYRTQPEVLTALATYGGRRNSVPFLGRPANTVLCVTVDAQPVRNMAGQERFMATWQFSYREGMGPVQAIAVTVGTVPASLSVAVNPNVVAVRYNKAGVGSGALYYVSGFGGAPGANTVADVSSGITGISTWTASTLTASASDCGVLVACNYDAIPIGETRYILANATGIGWNYEWSEDDACFVTSARHPLIDLNLMF